MISQAHKLTAGYVVDPAYSAETPSPPFSTEEGWYYSSEQVESFLISHTDKVAESLGFSSNDPAEQPVDCSRVFFKKFIGPGNVELLINGEAEFSLDGDLIETLKDVSTGEVILM
ncbi:MAG: hypothetical protein GX804_03785, partial [Lentisphaerae bacterium]|nr:hypothetical protein [Lentisphaerota bacterium]